MRVDLSSDFDTYIAELLASGQFKSANEAVETALAFFRHHQASMNVSDEELAARCGLTLDELRHEIALGVADADRGAFREWNLERFLADCRAARRA